MLLCAGEPFVAPRLEGGAGVEVAVAVAFFVVSDRKA